MKPSEEIFELVHSLNQTEKRYFKVFASRSSNDNVYIRLFDAIDSQKKYDERALREKFHDEPFVRQLHVAKNYLHKVILKSLAAYHSKTSVNARVLEILRLVEVLFEKGFYRPCEKMLVKGKELCREYEKYILLAQFCEWESKVLSRQSNYRKMHEEIVEQKEYLDNVRLTLDFKQKAFDVYEAVVKMGVARDKSEVKLLDKQISAPLLKRDDALLSNEARYYKYSAFSLHASATGNKKKHYDYTKKILEIFERSSALRNEYPNYYISSINNLCNALFYLGKIDDALKMVRKLRAFCNSSGINKWEDAYHSGLLISYDLEIAAYMNSGQFEKIPTLIHPVEEMLKQNGEKLKKSYLMDLIYDISYGLFILKDYDNSFAWLLKIINEQQFSLRNDIYSAGRILHLLLHYEMGNDQLLKNIIKPTARHLDKKKRLFQPERILLEFLDNQMKVKSKDKRAETFRALQTEIQLAMKKPLAQGVLQYLDIPAWIESKLLKKDLRNVLKEKVSKPGAKSKPAFSK